MVSDAFIAMPNVPQMLNSSYDVHLLTLMAPGTSNTCKLAACGSDAILWEARMPQPERAGFRRDASSSGVLGLMSGSPLQVALSIFVCGAVCIDCASGVIGDVPPPPPHEAKLRPPTKTVAINRVREVSIQI